jgi:hypothetical protein
VIGFCKTYIDSAVNEIGVSSIRWLVKANWKNGAAAYD